ncbi:MAG: hypothetical protein QFB87_04150 [Patescibacteria group bacterium]|nr:hypothetical protein [Patescibacteria group bacterium]
MSESTPQSNLHGGYTGQSFNRPILGLPEGMSVQEAHVLNMQQNAENSTQLSVSPETIEPVTNPDLITEVPDFNSLPKANTQSVSPLTGFSETGSNQLPSGNTDSAQPEAEPRKSRMARMLGRLGLSK